MIKLRLSRFLSSVNGRWILVGLTVIFCVVLLAPLCKGSEVGKFISDMLSPVSLRNMAYGKSDYGCWSSLAYALGLVILSGFLIPIVTNYLRTLGDRYITGTHTTYRWKNHILFLGYDELMLGTLKRMSQPTSDAGGSRKKQQIVVAVPSGVGALRTHLWNLIGDNVEVVQCDQCHEKDLRKRARVEHAKQVYIVGQPDDPTHDATNLATLGIVAMLWKPVDVQNTSVPCMYYIRNQATFYLLHRQKIQGESFEPAIGNAGLAFDLPTMNEFFLASEPFNVFESMARHLLIGLSAGGNELGHLEWTVKDDQMPHLIVIGMSAMGTAMARVAMMVAHFPGKTLRVTMVDEQMYGEMWYFMGRHRYFFENCKWSYTCFDDHSHDRPMPEKAKLEYLDVEVEFIQCNVASPELSAYLKDCVAPGANQALNVVVCTDDSPQNMAFALYQSRQILGAAVPIWVYQNGDDSMNPFLESVLYKNVHVFTPMEYGVADRPESVEWRLAKAADDGYNIFMGWINDAETKKGKYWRMVRADRANDNITIEELEKEMVKPWNKQQPQNKWSSLYGAISKVIMLRSVGYDEKSVEIKPGIVDQIPKVQVLGTEEVIDDAVVDSIAKAEHSRWNVEKLLNGHVPESQDIIMDKIVDKDFRKYFVHKDIKDFEDLSADEKDKDYVQIEYVVKELNNIYSQQNKENGKQIKL